MCWASPGGGPRGSSSPWGPTAGRSQVCREALGARLDSLDPEGGRVRVKPPPSRRASRRNVRRGRRCPWPWARKGHACSAGGPGAPPPSRRGEETETDQANCPTARLPRRSRIPSHRTPASWRPVPTAVGDAPGVCAVSRQGPWRTADGGDHAPDGEAGGVACAQGRLAPSHQDGAPSPGLEGRQGDRICTGPLFRVVNPARAVLGSHPAGDSVPDPFPSCWRGVRALLPALTRGGDSLGT